MSRMLASSTLLGAAGLTCWFRGLILLDYGGRRCRRVKPAAAGRQLPRTASREHAQPSDEHTGDAQRDLARRGGEQAGGVHRFR